MDKNLKSKWQNKVTYNTIPPHDDNLENFHLSPFKELATDNAGSNQVIHNEWTIMNSWKQFVRPSR